MNDKIASVYFLDNNDTFTNGKKYTYYITDECIDSIKYIENELKNNELVVYKLFEFNKKIFPIFRIQNEMGYTYTSNVIIDIEDNSLEEKDLNKYNIRTIKLIQPIIYWNPYLRKRPENEIKKENKNIISKIFNNIKFGIADKVKMSTYGPAFMSQDNTWIAYNKNIKKFIDATDFIYNDNINYFYMMPTCKSNIKCGDYIFNKDEWFRVLSYNIYSDYLLVENVITRKSTTILPMKNFFGFDYYIKLFYVGDLLFSNANATEDNPFGNILPFLLMNNKNNEIDNLFQLLLLNNKI